MSNGASRKRSSESPPEVVGYEPSPEGALVDPKPSRGAADALFSYRGEDVVQIRTGVCKVVGGYPRNIRVDQSSEFISRDLDLWGLPTRRHS
jgi:hypothetical protein